MKRSLKAYFLYGFILFTYCSWRCSGPLCAALGNSGCISALRCKDIIHCEREQARALGALESAGGDNNSYMWHDDDDEDEHEFLATRSFFLLVSLSCHMAVPTSGVCVWTQLGRKTETERDGGRVWERASAAINKRCHCRSSVVTCSFSCVSFFPPSLFLSRSPSLAVAFVLCAPLSFCYACT